MIFKFPAINSPGWAEFCSELSYLNKLLVFLIFEFLYALPVGGVKLVSAFRLRANEGDRKSLSESTSSSSENSGTNGSRFSRRELPSLLSLCARTLGVWSSASLSSFTDVVSSSQIVAAALLNPLMFETVSCSFSSSDETGSSSKNHDWKFLNSRFFGDVSGDGSETVGFGRFKISEHELQTKSEFWSLMQSSWMELAPQVQQNFHLILSTWWDVDCAIRQFSESQTLSSSSSTSSKKSPSNSQSASFSGMKIPCRWRLSMQVVLSLHKGHLKKTPDVVANFWRHSWWNQEFLQQGIRMCASSEEIISKQIPQVSLRLSLLPWLNFLLCDLQ